MTCFRPSVLREKILAQHRDIEEMLEALDGAASQLEAGRAEDLTWLRRAAGALGQVLEWHLSFEEHHLVPAVRESDGFGPVRAERLNEQHRCRRGSLEQLVREVVSSDREEVVDCVRTFTSAIRTDLRYDQENFLHDEILRDDPMRVDFSG
jgi:hypothetical protein